MMSFIDLGLYTDMMIAYDENAKKIKLKFWVFKIGGIAWNKYSKPPLINMHKNCIYIQAL